MIFSIKVEPNYKGINKIMQILYANMATLLTPLGGGNHGQIVSIMNTTLFTTLTTMVWTNLPDLGVYPAIPTTSTTVVQD